MILKLTLLTRHSLNLSEINILFQQSKIHFVSLTAQLLSNLILPCTSCSETETKLFILIEPAAGFCPPPFSISGSFPNSFYLTDCHHQLY